MQPVDIFHPLATLHWEEHASPPERPDNSCVYLHNKLYVGSAKEPSSNKLFISSPDFSSWTQVDTPTSHFGLTTYHSQLVLVGGINATYECENKKCTNDLWLSRDGSKWENKLPPMNKPRRRPLAVNAGSPECLIVTGGSDNPDVEVFIEGCWSLVAELDLPFDLNMDTPSSTFHNGNWYVGGCSYDDDSSAFYSSFYYRKVDDLVSAARTHPGYIDKHLLKRGGILFHDPVIPTSYEDELLLVEKYSGRIFAYSPHTQAWIHVGRAPGDYLLVPLYAMGKVYPAQILVMGDSYPVMPGVDISGDSEPLAKLYKAGVQCMYT